MLPIHFAAVLVHWDYEEGSGSAEKKDKLKTFFYPKSKGRGRDVIGCDHESYDSVLYSEKQREINFVWACAGLRQKWLLAEIGGSFLRG